MEKYKYLKNWLLQVWILWAWAFECPDRDFADFIKTDSLKLAKIVRVFFLISSPLLIFSVPIAFVMVVYYFLINIENIICWVIVLAAFAWLLLDEINRRKCFVFPASFFQEYQLAALTTELQKHADFIIFDEASVFDEVFYVRYTAQNLNAGKEILEAFFLKFFRDFWGIHKLTSVKTYVSLFKYGNTVNLYFYGAFTEAGMKAVEQIREREKSRILKNNSDLTE